MLRFLLRLIDVTRWVAPPSRRREWRRQWRADVVHAWQSLERRPHGLGEQATLATRTAGAIRHAFMLRMHVRRLEMITQDLRYGWRLMVRKPGFTAVAVLTLGLGVGANVTMFSWAELTIRRGVDGVDAPGQIASLTGTVRGRNDLSISYPDFVDYRAQRPDSIEDLIAFTLVPMNLKIREQPQRVFGELVSGNFFDVLGVRAIAGRTFLPDEDRTPGTHPVVVFSHEFWQRQFGGDPSIVGRPVTLNGRAFTVVGIAPPAFHGTLPYLSLDVFVPMAMQQAVTAGDRLSVRGNSWLEAMVRLKPGVPVRRAQADLDIVARRLAQTYPDDANKGVLLTELWRAPNAGGAAVVAMTIVELAVAAVVLLIACANVASLLLARAASRQRETAVRLTLGASRGRLVGQMLTESSLLAVAGGIAGVAIAYWTKDVIRWFVPPAPLPITMNPVLSTRVLLYAIGATAASVLAFGLVPAFQASGRSVVSALKESAGNVTASRRRTRVRQALVVAQVAMSLALLISAGLFARTLMNAQSIDPGFSTRSALLAAIDLQPAGYDTARGRAFYRDLLARVRETPGVEAASLASRVPLGFGGNSDFYVKIDGYTPAANELVDIYYNRVGSDYLRTMGIGLVKGREFTDRDTHETGDVGIVNETVARRYFAGRDPVGGRVRVGSRTIEIVGVARDGKYSSITEAPRAFMYLPMTQWYRPDTILHVKTAGDAAAMTPRLHDVVRSLDANVPLFDVHTLAEQLEIAIFMQRMLASVLGAFGVLALVLATVGLYGVVTAIAVQRVPEIGMRMALGATRRDILSLIMGQGLKLTAIGIGAGVAIAFGAARLFKSLLVGVSATDAVSFAGTALLLALVALAATWLPARRAASIDPLAALRND